VRLLITGGSSEIGTAIALKRFRMGDEIVFTGTSEASVEKTLQAYRELGVAAIGLVLDLSQTDAAPSATRAALKLGFGGLILNAASRVARLKRFHEHSSADWEESLRTNIEGNLWLIQSCLPGMMAAAFGRIVFVSSLSSVNGTSRYPLYCLEKAAMEGLMVNLAVDYGQEGILCNTLRLGIIATERNRRFWKRGHFAEKMEAVIPQGRFGTPGEVAEAIDPLLSRTSYVNGSVLTVSGGLPGMRSQGILGV